MVEEARKKLHTCRVTALAILHASIALTNEVLVALKLDTALMAAVDETPLVAEVGIGRATETTEPTRKVAWLTIDETAGTAVAASEVAGLRIPEATGTAL